MIDLKGKKVIARGINSGVFFGTLVDKNVVIYGIGRGLLT